MKALLGVFAEPVPQSRQAAIAYGRLGEGLRSKGNQFR
jgi:hypothetical protein